MNPPLASLPSSLRSVLLLAAAFGVITSVSGAAVVSDSFGNADGVALHGVVAGSRPAWVAWDNVKIENGRVTTDNAGSAELKLPVPNQTGGLLTLRADVSLGESGGDWIGLSFLASTGVGFFNETNTLSVILNAGGYVTLFKNQTGSPNIGQWHYPGFSGRGATYTLELRYDRTAQTADVYVNDVRLNSSPVGVTGLQGATFRAVGVRVHGAMANPAVDNFVYRTPDFEFADSFNLSDDTTLNGVVAGAAPAWVAPAAVRAENGFVTTTGTGSVEFKLPVPDETNGPLVLKADLRAGTAEWTGLFFGATPTSGYNDSDNPLLLILRNSGWVILFENGTTTQLAAWKSFQSLDLSRSHAVELHYDRDAGTVDVFLDGSRLNENPVSVGDPGNPRFSAVGVRFHGSSITAGGPAADNFLYRTPDFEIADSFDLPGGTTLNGVVAGKRPAWRVDGASAVFADGGVTTAAAGPSEFKLPVPNLASGRLALSADMRLGGDTSWAGIALLTSATPASGATSSFFNTQNPLLIIMRRSGQIALYKNGTSQTLGSSTIPAFSASDSRLLALEYDRDAGAVNVLVNGEPLNGLTAVKVGALNNPAFGAVGVRFHADSGVTIAAGGPALEHFIYAPDSVARGIPVPLEHRPGNVFLRGESAVLPPIPGHTGAWTVRNIDGASVASGSSAVGGIALGDQYPIGHYRVFFGSALAATFAVVEPLIAPVPDDSPVCLHTQFANRYILGNIGSIEDAASLAALAGVNGIRDATAWPWQWDDRNQLWLEDGSRGAESFDLLRLAARRSGLDLLMMVEPGTPPGKVVPADWGTRINKKFPADLRDYRDFVRRVATRAGGRVSAWEGWNEPEGIGGMHLGSEIASAMKTFALALRSTGSDALATMGLGHAPVESLHRNGYLDAIDLYNYHNHSSDADWAIKREALDPYTGSRPVWVSEASYGSYATVTNGTELTAEGEREQARDIPKIYARGLHDGNERVYYFTLVQVGETAGWQWGLLRAGTLQPRSGYLALAAAGRLLVGARPAGRLTNLPAGLEGWSFTSQPDGAHKGVLVLWSESGATVSWTPPTGAALFDLWGRGLPPATSISIGRDPVWCVLPLSTLQQLAREPVLARPAFSRPAPGDLCPVVADFRTADRFKNNHSGGCFLFTQTESELDVDVYNFSDTSLTGAWTAGPLTGFTAEVVTQPGTITAGGVGTLRVKLRRPAASWSAAAEVRWLTLTGAYGSQGESLLSIPFRQCPAEATPTTWKPVPGISNPVTWQSDLLSSGTTATIGSVGDWTRFDITFGPPPNSTIGLAWAAPYYVLAASEKPQTGAWGVGLDFRTQAVPAGTSVALNLVANTAAWSCPLPYDLVEAASGDGTRLLLPLSWFARIAHRSSPDAPESLSPGDIVRLEIEVIGAGGATVKIDVADIAWASGALQ